jgi:small subunit ribosomal protein S17
MSDQRNARRVLQGTVLSAKGQNTITITVERTFKHARYGKYLRRKKKYLAHDAKEEARAGDVVEIAATRPLSKRKRWRLVRVLEHSDLEVQEKSPDMELAEAEAAEVGAEPAEGGQA